MTIPPLVAQNDPFLKKPLTENVDMKLSIIIPAYNEENTIAKVLSRIDAMEFPFETELIVADDGSTDSTRDIIEATETSKVLKKHFSPINLGKGAAIRFALQLVEGDFIIIQDADLENDTRDILRIAEHSQKNGADIVYGSRFLAGERHFTNASPTNITANKIMTSYANLLYGSRLTDMATAYKLIRTSVIKRIRLRCTGFEFEPEITAKLLRLGYSIPEVPISYIPRTTEQGKKIHWFDGFKYMYYLTKYRFTPLEAFLLDG